MVSLGFNRVLYVPAFQSPLKDEPSTTYVHRLAMLELALVDCDWAEISTIELERGGTSYTINTIKSLIQEGDELRLLIGADQWARFEQWKQWEDILRLANPAIMPRVGVPVQDSRVLQITSLSEASSVIQEQILAGSNVNAHLHPDVKKYIAKHKLYQ
jgi:nicotinate-nucleotide adenylyltransferase